MPVRPSPGYLQIIPAVFAIAVLAAPAATQAQESASSAGPDPLVEAMAPLAWLAGDWEGEGWIQRGPGERHEFVQTERVEPAFGDRLLLVEGIGRVRTPEGPGPVVHHAFAVLSWDAERKAFRFDTYRAGENGVDAEASYEDGVFTWGFDAPTGQVRFRIRETEEGAWHETGEFSPDQGTTWYPSFEMTLHRVEGPSTGAGAGR